MKRILCWLGLHHWSSLGAAHRVCNDCGMVQSLQFQEWVTE